MHAAWITPQRYEDDFGGDADVIILPGSSATVRDLDYLRENGGERIIRSHLAGGGVVAGVCGGYQMLGQWLYDPFHREGDRTTTEGLGFLPTSTVFGRTMAKMTATGRCLLPEADNGIVIGEERRSGCTWASSATAKATRLHAIDKRVWLKPQPQQSWLSISSDKSVWWAPGDETDDGFVSYDRQVWGTYLHRIFYNHPFNKAFFASL